MTSIERMDAYNRYIAPHIPFDSDKLLAYLERNQYLEAPASTKYHGAWPGGWFDHSLCVMQQLVLLTERNGLTWQRPESPYIVGFLHDICKLDQYVFLRFDDNGKSVYAFKGDTLYKGHGDKSVLILSSLCQLTEEEVACIRYHMGAFVDKEFWVDYTRAIHQFPNVLWTHTADMIATHIHDR